MSDSRSQLSRTQLSRFMAVFAGGTLISRVLGLVRDVVIAGIIPTVARDAFLFAFRLPNMLREILGEGATNAAFVPIFAETQEHGEQQAFRELVSATFSAMILVLGMVTIAGVLLMPGLPWVLDLLRPLSGASRKDPEDLALTIQLMQWTFPYLFFIGLAAFAMAPLFTLRHYATPSWSPALLNVALIVCAVALQGFFENSAWTLVAGVWLGGVAQLAVLMLAMRKHAGVLWPNFHLRHPGIRKAGWLLLPVVFGQATSEVNKLVDNFFAYSLESGTVTALFYANRLVQLPLSIFGVAVSVAILPSISRAAARQDYLEVRDTILHGFRQTLFLVLPAMLGLIILREPIMRLLFERGEFDPRETEMAATALLYYGFGLLAFVWVKITVQGFYAMQDTRTPVLISTGCMFLNILLNAALVGPMGYRGLALATTISFALNFVLLYVFLQARVGLLWDAATSRSFARVGLSTVVACAAAYGVVYRLERHLGHATLPLQALSVLLPIAVAGVLYVALARALRVEELHQFTRLMRRNGR